MARSRLSARLVLREIITIAAAIAYSIPVYVAVSIALRDRNELRASPLGPPSPPRPGNFSKAWSASAETSTSLSQGLINSAVITAVTVTALILMGALGAYFIARTPGRFSSAMFYGFLFGLILPAQLSVIPLVRMLNTLGLTGSRIGIILFYVGFLMPLPVLLFTGFIRRIPLDLEESAVLDGASKIRTFLTIVLPLLRPVTTTVAVIGTLAVWNDLFTPLVLLGGSENATLPVAIYLFVGEHTTNWPLVFSAVLIAMAPILVLYVVGQRFVVEALSGGIRG
jgi:raffinose/stachyose/melibiose transport system permease protein